MQKSAPVTVDDLHGEIIAMIKQLNSWAKNSEHVDLGEVYVGIAGFRSRCFQMKVVALQSKDLSASRFIASEVDPFLDELTEQFKIWSRIGSIRQLDWDMVKG